MNQQAKLNKHQTYLIALGLFSRMKEASFNEQNSVKMIEELLGCFVGIENQILQNTSTPDVQEDLLSGQSNEISDKAPVHSEQPEPLNIMDWRDLQVGDVVRVYGSEFPIYAIEAQEDYEGRMAFAVKTKVGTVVWVNISEDKWKFISRPVSK